MYYFDAYQGQIKDEPACQKAEDTNSCNVICRSQFSLQPKKEKKGKESRVNTTWMAMQLWKPNQRGNPRQPGRDLPISGLSN
jgi:hypothetical protein